jgi:hypothetical protein
VEQQATGAGTASATAAGIRRQRAERPSTGMESGHGMKWLQREDASVGTSGGL